jgi:hypothetical protein
MLHHPGDTRQHPAVGRYRRGDPGLLQRIDQSEDADPQSVLALRPTAIVGIEAAEFAHKAWIAEAARWSLKIPVLQIQHHEEMESRRQEARRPQGEGAVCVVGVVHGEPG